MNDTDATPKHTPGDERTDFEIEAAISDKIQKAVEAAIASGVVGPDTPVGVVVGSDGSITVVDAGLPAQNDATAVDDHERAEPDRVELPSLYNEDRESLADTHYADHLKTHWGF